MSEEETAAPEGEYFARVPIDEMTLADAVGLVDDPSWWDKTMPSILQNYPHQVGLESYWKLTVKEHRLLFEWLVQSGVVKNGVNS